MKLQNLARFILELLLSFFIKRVVQVNVPITGNVNVDNIIYGIVSYGIILFSLFNLVQVFIAHRRGKEKKKLSTFASLGVYAGVIIVAIGIWQLIKIWVFWVVFGGIIIGYLIYYFKNRSYKKEIRLFKKSIKKALSVEFDFKLHKLKINSHTENFITITTSEGVYYVLAVPTEEITRPTSDLETLDKDFSIVATSTDDKYILLRYITLFVLKEEKDLVGLYTYLTEPS